MMEIYVFDKDINLKGILENYFSLRWIRKYSKSGEFELHCSLNSNTLDLLKRGNIIYKNDDLEAGYIQHRHLKLDQQGKEILIVRGKFLTGYLGSRIIWDRFNFKGTTELAIRNLITNNAINPTNTDRKINLLQLGDVKSITGDIDFQVSQKNLLEEVENIALNNELGIRSLLDIQSKLIKFDIYKGLDRTVGQTINPIAIFSREFENILEQEYIDSITNYKNVALVAGECEGIARVLVVEGSGVGLDRYETFVDARDLQKESMATLDYEKKLKERGNLKLSEFTDIKTFESKINLQSNLKYKVDFDLGDIVTCTSKAWNVTVDSRITEIEEVYEHNGLSINVVFGNNIPNLIDKIKAVM